MDHKKAPLRTSSSVSSAYSRVNPVSPGKGDDKKNSFSTRTSALDSPFLTETPEDFSFVGNEEVFELEKLPKTMSLRLSQFDRDVNTRTLCLLALVIAYIAAFTAVGFAVQTALGPESSIWDGAPNWVAWSGRLQRIEIALHSCHRQLGDDDWCDFADRLYRATSIQHHCTLGNVARCSSQLQFQLEVLCSRPKVWR